jgi:hypothetical protein
MTTGKAVGLFLLIGLASACSSTTTDNGTDAGTDSSKPTSDGGSDATADTSPTTDASEAGDDGSASDDGGTDGSDGAIEAGICANEKTDAGACNALTNVGSTVVPTCGTGAMPTGTGGPILDGTYVETSQTSYAANCADAGAGDSVSSTTVFAAGGCAQSVLVDQTNSTTHAFSYSFSTGGNTITITPTCPTAGATQQATFTATGNTITLINTSAKLVQVLTKQ